MVNLQLSIKVRIIIAKLAHSIDENCDEMYPIFKRDFVITGNVLKRVPNYILMFSEFLLFFYSD